MNDPKDWIDGEEDHEIEDDDEESDSDDVLLDELNKYYYSTRL